MSAELLGIPRPFEYKGNQYLVAFRDVFVQTQFSEFVKSEAALELWRLKSTAPPDFYADQQKIYADKLHSKAFKWGTPTVHAAYWSDEGQRHMLWLKMKRGEEKGGAPIERVIIDQIAEDEAKWNELLMILWEQDEPDFFEEIKKEMGRQKTPGTSQSETSTSNPKDSTSTTP